jgi:hypothetical protein
MFVPDTFNSQRQQVGTIENKVIEIMGLEIIYIKINILLF